MQIAVSGAGERNGCTLHLVYKSKIQQHEQRIFHMMDRGYLSVHGSTCRTHHACRHFSLRDCGNENCGMSRSRWCPWAGICCKLSDAVRSNSDWWKIRKTDCMGWWTAVSQINLAISDPAELTIVSRGVTSISDSGSYSDSVTHVSEMSTESWNRPGSAMQARICVKWCENFQTK